MRARFAAGSTDGDLDDMTMTSSGNQEWMIFTLEQDLETANLDMNE